MSIGGESRMGRVRANEIRRHAEACGLDEGACVNVMGNLATAILREVAAVFADVEALPGDASCRGGFAPP